VPTYFASTSGETVTSISLGGEEDLLAMRHGGKFGRNAPGVTAKVTDYDD